MKLKSVVATLIITIVLVAGLVGCGKADRAKLDRVDSLFAREHADSSMRLLRTN